MTESSARDIILGRIRRAVSSTTDADNRAAAVRNRLEEARPGVVPRRGQLPPTQRTALFIRQAEAVQATVERASGHEAVPTRIGAYLRARNLPAQVRMGGDSRLKAMDWGVSGAPEVLAGASDGTDLASTSYAFAGIAETGTLVLPSGPDNPTTLNFLPEYHIVVIDADDIEGDMESAWGNLRKTFGKGELSRAVNFITGPSRSADIEQTLLLGAHGPRALHIIVVDGKAAA